MSLQSSSAEVFDLANRVSMLRTEVDAVRSGSVTNSKSNNSSSPLPPARATAGDGVRSSGSSGSYPSPALAVRTTPPAHLASTGSQAAPPPSKASAAPAGPTGDAIPSRILSSGGVVEGASDSSRINTTTTATTTTATPTAVREQPAVVRRRLYDNHVSGNHHHHNIHTRPAGTAHSTAVTTATTAKGSSSPSSPIICGRYGSGSSPSNIDETAATTNSNTSVNLSTHTISNHNTNTNTNAIQQQQQQPQRLDGGSSGASSNCSDLYLHHRRSGSTKYIGSPAPEASSFMPGGRGRRAASGSAPLYPHRWRASPVPSALPSDVTSTGKSRTSTTDWKRELVDHEDQYEEEEEDEEETAYDVPHTLEGGDYGDNDDGPAATNTDAASVPLDRSRKNNGGDGGRMPVSFPQTQQPKAHQRRRRRSAGGTAQSPPPTYAELLELRSASERRLNELRTVLANSETSVALRLARAEADAAGRYRELQLVTAADHTRHTQELAELRAAHAKQLDCLSTDAANRVATVETRRVQQHKAQEERYGDLQAVLREVKGEHAAAMADLTQAADKKQVELVDALLNMDAEYAAKMARQRATVMDERRNTTGGVCSAVRAADYEERLADQERMFEALCAELRSAVANTEARTAKTLSNRQQAQEQLVAELRADMAAQAEQHEALLAQTHGDCEAKCDAARTALVNLEASHTQRHPQRNGQAEFDDLAQAFKDQQRCYEERLQQQQQAHERQCSELRAALANLAADHERQAVDRKAREESSVTAFTAALAAAEAGHAADTEAARTAHEAVCRELRAALSSAAADHRRRSAEAATHHGQACAQLRDSLGNQVAEFDGVLAASEAAHRHRCAELEAALANKDAAYGKELAAQGASHREEVADLRGELLMAQTERHRALVAAAGEAVDLDGRRASVA